MSKSSTIRMFMIMSIFKFENNFLISKVNVETKKKYQKQPAT